MYLSDKFVLFDPDEGLVDLFNACIVGLHCGGSTALIVTYSDICTSNSFTGPLKLAC